LRCAPQALCIADPHDFNSRIPRYWQSIRTYSEVDLAESCWLPDQGPSLSLLSSPKVIPLRSVSTLLHSNEALLFQVPGANSPQPMNKQALSERDICTKFITPAVKRAGWDEMTQIREEVSFTKWPHHRNQEG
jgi:hypothetical protein